MDGRLFTISESKWYKYLREPSDEVDQLWNLLSAEGREAVLTDADTLRAAGHDPQKLVSFPQDSKWTDGRHLYPVQIDVFHQIHCLDVLRKQMHAYHYFENQTRPENSDYTSKYWNHLNHCLSMLLQNVVCRADDSLIPHRWVENSARPYADFSIKKQCRNFEGMSQWNAEHAIGDINAKWAALSRPRDAFVHPGWGEDHT